MRTVLKRATPAYQADIEIAILPDETVRQWRIEIARGMRGPLDQMDQRFLDLCDVLLKEREHRRGVKYPYLTVTQTMILRAIQNLIIERGTTLSLRNICDRTGRSMSVVFDAVHVLKKHGYVTNDPGKHRSFRSTPPECWPK